MQFLKIAIAGGGIGGGVINISDQKLIDLTNLWFFKLIVTKSNFKNQL